MTKLLPALAITTIAMLGAKVYENNTKIAYLNNELSEVYADIDVAPIGVDKPKTKKYSSTLEIKRNTTTITVRFVDEEDLKPLFRKAGGKASKTSTLYGFSVPYGDTCNITMADPKGWNNTERHRTLGHEVLHCLGADHE
jgi:hypothetical protein